MKIRFAFFGVLALAAYPAHAADDAANARAKAIMDVIDAERHALATNYTICQADLGLAKTEIKQYSQTLVDLNKEASDLQTQIDELRKLRGPQ